MSEEGRIFMDAIKRGERETVRQMNLSNPRLKNSTSQSGVSAVMIAIYYDQVEIARDLIAQGAQLNVFDAAASGQTDTLRRLLDEDPQRLDEFSSDGFQPLGLAAYFGHLEAVKLLLARGALPNTTSRNPQSVQPLHSAVAGQHLEIARLLLEHGAEANARQADDFTPLHGAAQNGQMAMVELLLANGADRQAHKADGLTPAEIARAEGFNEIANLLD